MIAGTLIPNDVLHDHAEDPSLRFANIAQFAHEELQRRLAEPDPTNGFSHGRWKSQYIHQVSAVAEALGIKGLPDPNTSDATSAGMVVFDSMLSRIVTKILVTSGAPPRSETVALAMVTKSTIRDDLEKLRETVNASNLSDEIKDALHRKIDAVEKELSKERFGMRPMWILHGALAAVNLSGVLIGALADAKPATEYVQSIEASVMADKSAERREELRLTNQPARLTHNPVKAIEDKSNQKQ